MILIFQSITFGYSLYTDKGHQKPAYFHILAVLSYFSAAQW